MFIGRKKELEELKNLYESDESRLGLIYGPYGYGKTSLVLESVKNIPYRYLSFFDSTPKDIIATFREEPGFETAETFEDILDSITESVIIVDGYDNLQKASSKWADALYFQYATKWQDSVTKLILITDSLLSLDKMLLGDKSPWRDIIDYKLCLKPFSYYEAAPMFKNLGSKEALFSYGITGGIPYNLARIGKTPKDTASKLFVDKDKASGLIPCVFMNRELRELGYYNYVLKTLSKGCNRVMQISEEIDKPKDVVVPYLNTLISLGLCEKHNPVNEPGNRKKTRYILSNSSVSFYYRYIAGNYKLFEMGKVDELWSIIEADFAVYIKNVFKDICKQYLLRENVLTKRGLTINAVGNMWVNDDDTYTSEGFDIVALAQGDEGESTIYCLCFSDENPVDMPKLRTLLEKGKRLGREGKDYYVAFSVSGFNENVQTAASALKNLMLISLDEVQLNK